MPLTVMSWTVAVDVVPIELHAVILPLPPSRSTTITSVLLPDGVCTQKPDSVDRGDLRTNNHRTSPTITITTMDNGSTLILAITLEPPTRFLGRSTLPS